MGKDSEKGKYSSPEGSCTWEYITAVVFALSMLSIGNMMGWISPSLSELRGPNSTITVTPDDASTLSACMSFGHILALPSTIVIDKIGRRNSLMVSTVPIIVSWAMISLAEHVMVLIVARTVAGLTMGLMICTIPIYTAEIFSTNIRGSLGSIGSIAFYIGILLTFAITPPLGFRITAGVCMGLGIIFLISLWFLPESPYFLVMVGRVEEAEGALEKLRGKKDVADEIELIEATLRERGKALVKSSETENGAAPGKQSALRKLFTIRGNVKSLILSITLMTLHHLYGLITILNYCHILLEAMSAEVGVYTASLILSVLQIVSAALCVITIDRFRRRTLIFTTGVTGVILLAIIATYFYMMEHMHIDVKQYGTIPLCAMFTLVMMYNIGIGGMNGIIQGEILATDIKVLASGIVSLYGSLMSLVATKVYLLMAMSWGYGHSIPFFGYAVAVLLCTVVLAKWLPETKGKTLLQIQKELNA